MGLKKYLGIERRRHSRYQAGVEMVFRIWDAAKQEPRTPIVQGRLTDISLEGARLQTNKTLIEGHHILLNNDPEGKTPLVLGLPSSPEGEQWNLKAQVLWYNKVETARRYQFDVGLRFVDLSQTEREKLEGLLKSLTTV
ncbi:MAG: PilZ domain-containing protein [Syntrophobacteria bacterium]